MKRLAVCGLMIGILAPGHAAIGAAAPSQAEIDRAIGRGIKYLRGEQGGGGSWTFSFNHDHELGITALAALALMENGAEPADPAVVKAVDAVKSLAGRSDQTYDLSLAILALARAQKGQPGPDDPLIRRLAARLAAGANGGMWSYLVPVGDDTGGGSRRRRTARRFSQFVSKPGDNSNTQFALLGIWAAGRHGFDPNDDLSAIDGHFRGTQDSRGHWGYVPGDQPGDAMTCAGLMALAMAAARPALAERQTARARGAALAADRKFAAALRAVSRDARAVGKNSDVYYLWSLERVCVALGLRDLDGLDWYAVGSAELLRRQSDDGGWPEEQWGRLPNTCLALLFLRKANLAFELDRVLKLPGGNRPKGPEPAGPELSAPAASDEAAVVVTAASDAKFPEISVDFEVKRPDGSFVLDAKPADFHVSEEGAPVPDFRLQAPSTVEARPITVVLVVDRSRSMEEEDRIGTLKRAVSTFLAGLPKGSRVAVVAFGSEVEKICPFTGDFEEVRKAVDRLTPAGATRYYDAVAESLELIHGEPGRRAILALTDGEDTFSQSATPDSLIVAARRLGLPIHTLGLGSDDEIESDALRRLAQATRGQYYPARQADQLQAIYEQIAARLRSSYTLTYRTGRSIPDGTLRPVRVTFRTSRQSGEAAVFVPGMVVPAPGWPRLFVAMAAGFAVLAFLPGWLGRRASP